MNAGHRTVILNEVDILGNEPLFATVRRKTQVVFRFGATNRPFDMEHGPDSRHVFVPRDCVKRNDVNVTRAPRDMVVRRTVNPGMRDTDCGVTD